MKEQILELKATAEAAIKSFKTAAKELSSLGFNVAVQPDDSVYVYKDVREAYGELVSPTREVSPVRKQETCEM